MSGTEREAALLAAAKKEGKVVIYTSVSGTGAQIVPAFKKAYPDINVEIVTPGSNEELRTRVLQQAEAGKNQNDLIETTGTDMQAVYAQQGVLSPYTSEIRDALPEDAKFNDWTVDQYYLYLPAWNTKLISAADVPKTFQALGDPKWSHKIAFVNGDSEWYLTLHEYYKRQGMSDDDFADMMKRIAANATPSDGHATTAGLLAAGDYSIALPLGVNSYMVLADKGAPVSGTPWIEPVVQVPNGIGLMKDARHPAAALLFMDWYLSKGQPLLLNTYKMPVTTRQLKNPPAWLPPQDKLIAVPIKGLTTDDLNAWIKAYDNLLKGHGNVLPAA